MSLFALVITIARAAGASPPRARCSRRSLRHAWTPRSRRAPNLRGWFAHHLPTDKGGWHDYLDAYDPILARYRDRARVRLSEVGLAKGGSLVL